MFGIMEPIHVYCNGASGWLKRGVGLQVTQEPSPGLSCTGERPWQWKVRDASVRPGRRARAAGGYRPSDCRRKVGHVREVAEQSGWLELSNPAPEHAEFSRCWVGGRLSPGPSRWSSLLRPPSGVASAGDPRHHHPPDPATQARFPGQVLLGCPTL